MAVLMAKMATAAQTQGSMARSQARVLHDARPQTGVLQRILAGQAQHAMPLQAMQASAPAVPNYGAAQCCR